MSPSENAPYQADRKPYAFAPVGRFFDSDADAAELLGTTRRNVQRWHHEGLSLKQAESIADRLGEHPFVLWPEMREHLIEATKPDRSVYRRAYYEANREREIAAQRERDRRDAEAKCKYGRWYYRTHREQVLARQRAYDARKREERKAG